ncbi:aryl-sulfate sulfotransferase [Salinirubellus salinus]|uniref:Aryl-sulfate sulfotransferase n=1 Tax=Salinirubellus salinus TaxID=1364945 RepID=A0A9E7UA77_9EURY|nr:aryl-sulfate sulfotransferase [Salinirubellus salinus]UWM56716.1 aryl-sulfate sulfotransferase [Salinirubellus salinus]
MESRRVALPLAVLLLSVAVIGAAAAGGGGTAPAQQQSPANETDPANATVYPGNTLLGLQAEGWFGNNNGSARVVNPEGETVWEWRPENGRVFDVEALDNGNVLASVAIVPEDCPPQYGDTCVHNRVVELDYPNENVVWEYDWYDVFPNHHEVHDADRLENGETAIIDMGNNRAFTVNEAGDITWQWNATEHISEGTPFFEEYVPEGSAEEFRQGGPESDWTHMNDIDRLENGNFQLSIRNFDVLLEVDPETNDIVDVVGRPTAHSVMNEQHNPMRLNGTVLIADSENDRVVEVDVDTNEVVWEYDGTGSGELLQWPRDVDRLPNGNTLVTDSRNFRLLEIDRTGEVVWRYEMKAERGIVYEADRMGVPEEQARVSGDGFESRTSDGPLGSALATADSWLGFVPFLPTWMGPVEVLAALSGLGALGFLAVQRRREATRHE